MLLQIRVPSTNTTSGDRYTTLDGTQIAPSTEYAEYIAQYQGSQGDGLNAEISENAMPFETFFDEEALDAWYEEHGSEQDVKYSMRLSSNEVSDIQSIGRKSVNEFTSEDIRKTEKLAQRYYQEMGTKSPFFRAWFGDWRANDSTAVQIANQIGDARGEVTNADTGWTIRVSRKVFVETNAHEGKANTEATKYLSYINDIVRKAVLLDTYGMGKSKSVGSLLMHNFYTIVDDGNGATLLKLYVEEMNDINTEATGKRAYQLQNIENRQLVVTGSGNSLAVSSSTADVKSVADLFAAVKRAGELKSAKGVNSLLLNADGSPKIMYHGSPNSFTVFDIRKAKSSGLYGRGFYFTDSKSHGSTYGNVYEAYLSIQNPLTPNGSDVTRNQVRKFLEAVAENEDYSIENYGTYDVNEILRGVYRNDAFAVIQDVNGTNYDGIVVDSLALRFLPVSSGILSLSLLP